MSLEIRPIQLPGDRVAFVDVWFDLYKDDPHWVAPLRFERKTFFDPAKNPYFEHAEVQLFIAYRDGRAVGTISAHVDKKYQAVEPGVGFFGFFEFVRDEAVAKGLLDAALAWLKQKGMARAMGPFNFNTNHECGLLVDGFDDDPLVAMVWNPSWYGEIYEKIGLTKTKDLYAYWLVNDGPMPERIQKLAERFEQKHPNFKVRSVNLKNWPKEVERAREIYNDAWSDNWGFVKMSDAEFDKLADDLKPMIDERFCYVGEIDGKAVCFSITLPDFNFVVKPMKGRLFPFGWWYYLTLPKKVRKIRVFTLGVAKEYQHLPLGAPLYKATWDAGRAANVLGAEASWILEDNTRMRGAMEKLGGKIYKTYRIYGATL